MTSHQITHLTNTDILVLNLTSVQQCIIDDIDELHAKFVICGDHEKNIEIRGISSNS